MNDTEREIYDNIIENYRTETNRCIDHIVKSNFRYFIACIASLLTIICVVAMFLIYLYQYDFSSETTTTTSTSTSKIEVEQSADDGSDTNYIGGDGDITNGSISESDNNKNKESNN